MAKRNLRFWEEKQTLKASPRFEKSLENPEASLWIIDLCDFHLRNVRGLMGCWGEIVTVLCMICQSPPLALTV